MGLFSLINLLMLLLSRKDNDVFLSFSHHDIGKNFGDHLFKDLISAGIRTLRDDGGIYAGKKSDIKKAIQESRISVVVFSKGYASSTKCLEQLVHIMDARNKTGLLVLPVFYNVDPSEVRKQKGLFEEAFAKHEKSFHKEMARVKSWRDALKEAADLAGMVLQQDSTYDVFLSFRGENTRRSFTDHLYTALCRAEIRTFRDDDGIRRGEKIDLEIKKAINETKLSIIVFSKDYASSRWCLDELAMIMERRRTVGHIVFPVFYDVDPSEVGTQTGRYGEELAKHEIRFKDQMEKVEGWRKALKEVAYMEGMVLEDGYESKFIESIVKEIADKLNLSLPHVRPSALPLASALRPPSYFFGLLREWRSLFQTPLSLFIFFYFIS
ncbi:uncharacterized protein [Populus alba]|uniref:uncharacterized protein n=1 Tax=Populus alba TaxID=43335 RepID=UPI00158EFEE6|nr:TMV resistance protein N-like [Populus alba]